jgi:hypothetical protein
MFILGLLVNIVFIITFVWQATLSMGPTDSPLAKVVSITSGAKETSQILETCKQFDGELFLEGSFESHYQGSFEPFFTRDGNYYLKSKMLCGALITLDGAEGKDIDGAVAQINEALPVELRAEDIRDVMGYEEVSEGEGTTYVQTKEEREWLAELAPLLAGKIEEGVR